MYKHKVQYRYKTKEGNLSAVKELDFELDKELYYDGPGAWRDICRNMIANKTGLNKSDIMNDSLLHFTCKGKINTNSSSTPSNNSNNSNNASWNSNTNRVTNNESSQSDGPPRVSFSKCSYCGVKYVISDGYYSYLRPYNNKNRHSAQKFHFCSIDCINRKVENGWVRVDEVGYTEEEGKKPATSEAIERLDRSFNRYIVKKNRKEAENELENTRKQAESLAACGPQFIDNIFTKKANHLESLLNETYPDRLKELEKSEKDAQRKKRANELRSQGKNIQAFVLEFQNILIAMSVFLVAGIFFFFLIQNNESNKADAMERQYELELIEDSVKIYINNKKYDNALILANKLSHSSNEDMENMEFDAWNGYPKYDEYWDKKREEYKSIILNRGTLETKTKSNKNNSNNNSSSNKPKSNKNDFKENENNEQIQNDVPTYDEELDPEYQN